MATALFSIQWLSTWHMEGMSRKFSAQTTLSSATALILKLSSRITPSIKEEVGYITQATVKRITAGACSAIRSHSKTGSIAALRHDLRNGPHHCLGDHSKCTPGGFCHHAPQESSTSKDTMNSPSTPISENSSSGAVSMRNAVSPLESLPPGLLRSVEAAGDRLVSKSAKLIQDKTTNLSESFMSVRSKMDGSKYYNRIQSRSFQVWCMAAAVRLQLEPGWVAALWQRHFKEPEAEMFQFSNSRKRKHEKDCVKKISQKYKRQRLAVHHGVSPAQSDHTYGDNAIQPDVELTVLKSLCEDYFGRTVSEKESADIATRTVLQAEDDTGEWELQRKGRLTASHFGEIAKRRASYTPLTTRLVYGKSRDTKATRHGRMNEPVARQAYAVYLLSRHPIARVQTTRVHIDVAQGWLAASPDGLVYDPSTDNPDGLVEIKCPFRAVDTSLLDLCTKPELKTSNFCLEYKSDTGHFRLKRSHHYYYQVQGQLHVTRRTWCDFFVWTPRQDDRVVEHIAADEVFWNTIYPKLRRFYLGSMLPELVNPRHPSGQPVREYIEHD